MPLALITLGSQVCDKYEVIIIDARIFSENQIAECLNENLDKALLVGVTSLTGAPLKDAVSFSQKIKKLNPTIPIVWGGWHTSLFPEQVLREINEVDYAVQGQGEVTFTELVKCLEEEKDVSSINGLVYRSNTDIIKNAPRPMEDINNFPRLNYDLINVENYFQLKGRRQFDFITSIGCYFRCTFCADPFVFNRKYSGLLPDRIVDDLSYYKEKYNFDDVNFQDETFFTYKERIVEMANQFIQRKLNFSWAATMRADQGARMTMEEFEICKKSGLRRLLIGVESGSQAMLNLLKKDIKLEQVLLCAERCKELEIAVIFPFIIGFPQETENDVKKSKELIRKLALMSPQFQLPIFYFKPYPGTSITDEVVKRGEFILPTTIQEWAKFDYVNSKGPWLSDDKFIFFEKYKFYLGLLKHEKRTLLKPLIFIAKRRINKFAFNRVPEKKLIEMIYKKQELS